MLTQIINGHILTPQGWLKEGSLLISDGVILEVTNSDLAVLGAKVIDAKGTGFGSFQTRFVEAPAPHATMVCFSSMIRML